MLTNTTTISIGTPDGADTSFAFGFRVDAAANLAVWTLDTTVDTNVPVLATVDVNYTIDTGSIGNESGGSITWISTVLTSDHRLVMLRVNPLTQTTDLKNQGSYNPSSVENRLDIITQIFQELDERLDRTLTIPVTNQTFDTSIPPINTDKPFLSVNTGATAFEWVSSLFGDVELSDLDITGATTNDVIFFNGTNWVYGFPTNITATNITATTNTIVDKIVIEQSGHDDVWMYNTNGELFFKSLRTDTTYPRFVFADGDGDMLYIGYSNGGAINALVCKGSLADGDLGIEAFPWGKLWAADIDLTGTITVGSGSNIITTTAGLIAHAKIDPAIAGSGITNTAGVLSVATGTGVDHGGLNGLAHNDHPQYAILLGGANTFSGTLSATDITATSSIIIGASDFTFDPSPGAGTLDLISDTVACSLRLTTDSGTTLGVLSVLDGKGTVLAGSTTGTKDVIIATNGAGIGTVTRLTIDGTSGLATFAGNIVATGAEVTLHSLAGGYGYVTQKDLTGAVEFGLRMQSTGQTILNSSSGAGLVLSNNAVSMLSFDGSQNAIFTGDVEVGGQLTVDETAGGENALWEHWLAPDNGLYVGGADIPTLTTHAFAGNRRISKVFEMLGTDGNIDRLYGSVALPYNYQSSLIIFDYYWVQNGTGAGTVKFTMQTFADEHGDDMSPILGGGNTVVTSTALGNNTDLQISTSNTVVPHDSGETDITGNANRLIHFAMYRHADSDTLADSVYLIGVRVRFA